MVGTVLGVVVDSLMDGGSTSSEWLVTILEWSVTVLRMVNDYPGDDG